ncbi:toxin-antitoxin system YwqK family antitoxin [Flavobacterium sp. RHBU_24]|uniref:toxin-antitoxin system YwqK family antitoxin n=1 Tax=Flavobacterium sp. RHBU_24 TaxID=3391185 RepID=UPI003984BB53
MRKFSLFIAFVLLCSFSDTSLIKRISDVHFRYEFYTTTKKVNPKKGRDYYWFKGGAIHNSEYGTAGELLQDDFNKYYHSNQLAESGKFKNGLKEGLWKNWYEDGTLQSETYWDGGLKDGDYYLYDPAGVLVEKGSYNNNAKNGRWINYISKDTLKYHNGSVVMPKAKKPEKPEDTITANKHKFFRNIFRKKNKDNTTGQMADGKQKNAASKKREKASNGENGEVTKRSFFGKLFSKKEKEDVSETSPAENNKKEKLKDKKVSTDNKEKESFWSRLFHKKKQDKK